MSLNGLDHEAIVEAFQAANTEPGGWFLLEYKERDEVGLLARGNGGIPDLRNAIAGYTASSPLYGFVKYRRRTVLVRYVPEGTSRLLQARVAVHFQAVAEKFSPHDTVFPITSSTDLKETALSAACSLHAASNSTSSTNSSVRKRRLGEIAEDAEENRKSKQSEPDKPLPPLPSDGRPMKAGIVSQSSERVPGEDTQRAIRDAFHSATLDPARSGRSSLERSLTAKTAPLAHARQESSAATFAQGMISRDNEDRRQSSNSLRPTTQELYNQYNLSTKPKVKLGPRPSLDIGGRPHTAGAAQRQFEPRPVSTLPVGLRIAPRKTSTASQAQTRSPTSSIPSNHSVTSPLQSTTAASPSLSPPERPRTSHSSIKSSATSAHSVIPKTPPMSPEKQRLMKALELRKKQMNAAKNIVKKDEVSPEITASTESPVSAASIVTEEVSSTETELNGTNCKDAPQEVLSEATTVDATGSSPVTVSNSPEPASTNASSLSDSHEQHGTFTEHRKSRVGSIDAIGKIEVAPEALREAFPTGQYGADVEPPNNVEAESSKSEEPSGPLDLLPLSDLPATPMIQVDAPEAREVQDLTSPGTTRTYSSEGTAETVKTVALENAEKTAATTESAEMVKTTSLVEAVEAVETPCPEMTWSSSDVHDSAATGKETMEDSSAAIPENEPTPSAQDVELLMGPEQSRQDAPGSMSMLEGNGSVSATSGLYVGEEQQEIAVQDERRRTRYSTSSETSAGTASKTTSAKQSHRRRRRGIVDPIRTDITPDDSDDNLLSDDSLMKELRAATVQEAKPVAVAASSQSPLTSGFPGGQSNRRPSAPWVTSRSVSSSVIGGAENDNSSDGSRSVSGPMVITKGNKQGPIAMIKKINVSSGISQRIKALELLSSHTSSPTSPPASAAPSPSASLSRKKSVRPTIIKSDVTHAGATKDNINASSSTPSLEEFGRKSVDVDSRNGAHYNEGPGRSRRESVSVKARIIRNPMKSFPEKPNVSLDPTDPAPLELHESPLTITHHPATSSSRNGRTSPTVEGQVPRQSALETPPPPPRLSGLHQPYAVSPSPFPAQPQPQPET